MTWMITGGAGYIGAHIVQALRAEGIDTIVLDDLSSGFASFVPDNMPFIEASVLDTDVVAGALADHSVSGVIHCAGFKYAGESVKRPVHTYMQNVSGTASLLDAMARVGVPRLVFSSSAGVYGTPATQVVTESTPTSPESPYGESKLVGEWLIRDQDRATASDTHPLRATSLRYFNVAGSVGTQVYDASPHNLLPRVFAGLRDGRAPVINGADYDTLDGTCVRDYVHVGDLALAHVAAARALDAGSALQEVYNLGSGTGSSVREIMDAIVTVTGTDLEPIVGARRPGDPSRIVADGALASRDLGWEMRHSITDMVASAWAAFPRP